MARRLLCAFDIVFGFREHCRRRAIIRSDSLI
jgi:hypothetical protein